MAIDAYTGTPVASMALAGANSAAQNQASQDSMQGNYDRQVEVLARQQARDIKERQDLLRRTAATQRARLGALGISGGGGSADALINGLQRQTSTEVADIQSAYDTNLSNLNWKRQRQQDQLGQDRRDQMTQYGGQIFSLF